MGSVGWVLLRYRVCVCVCVCVVCGHGPTLPRECANTSSSESRERYIVGLPSRGLRAEAVRTESGCPACTARRRTTQLPVCLCARTVQRRGSALAHVGARWRDGAVPRANVPSARRSSGAAAGCSAALLNKTSRLNVMAVLLARRTERGCHCCKCRSCESAREQRCCGVCMHACVGAARKCVGRCNNTTCSVHHTPRIHHTPAAIH